MYLCQLLQSGMFVFIKNITARELILQQPFHFWRMIWNSEAQEQDEIYYPDEDYSEVEPVIVPVAQPTGKKDKEGRYKINPSCTHE